MEDRFQWKETMSHEPINTIGWLHVDLMYFCKNLEAFPLSKEDLANKNYNWEYSQLQDKDNLYLPLNNDSNIKFA
jgi:hypothetical protein